jgi:pimeloyl-ACP methyl ester carboxylesterase
MTGAGDTREIRYAAQDGLELSVTVHGSRPGHALPVVCLPGLTRNARDFADLAWFLSAKDGGERQVYCFDYRGRGRSSYDRNWENYNPVIEAGDIIAGLTALDIAHAHFIGTSRGGIILHFLAAMRPGALKSIVLNDVGPEIGGAGLAQIKRYLESAPKPGTFPQAAAVLKDIHGKAFPALGNDDWERFALAVYRNENGKPIPDYDPALLNVVKGWDLTNAIPTMWPQFEGLRSIPAMVIRGENSMLLTAETVAKMKKIHPHLETVTVPGQGHAPLLETGDLPARIADFIARSEPID